MTDPPQLSTLDLPEEGVLIVGSGMSHHTMRGFMTQQARPHSTRFDAGLAL
ncbi:MAG TPA: hypothetical protein VN894_08705 [Polyangiaceae bacterium]|nr:hypothetical protein [Polyangiaceae bacterium]